MDLCLTQASTSNENKVLQLSNRELPRKGSIHVTPRQGFDLTRSIYSIRILRPIADQPDEIPDKPYTLGHLL